VVAAEDRGGGGGGGGRRARDGGLGEVGAQDAAEERLEEVHPLRVGGGGAVRLAAGERGLDAGLLMEEQGADVHVLLLDARDESVQAAGGEDDAKRLGAVEEEAADDIEQGLHPRSGRERAADEDVAVIAPDLQVLCERRLVGGAVGAVVAAGGLVPCDASEAGSQASGLVLLIGCRRRREQDVFEQREGRAKVPSVFLGGGAVDGDVAGLRAVVGFVGLGPVGEASDVEEAKQVYSEAVGGLAVRDVHLVVEDRAGGRGAAPAREDGVLGQWRVEARDFRRGSEVGGEAAGNAGPVAAGH